MQAEKHIAYKTLLQHKRLGFSPVVISVATVSMSMFIGVNWKGLSDNTGGDDSY